MAREGAAGLVAAKAAAKAGVAAAAEGVVLAEMVAWAVVAAAVVGTRSMCTGLGGLCRTHLQAGRQTDRPADGGTTPGISQ